MTNQGNIIVSPPGEWGKPEKRLTAGAQVVHRPLPAAPLAVGVDPRHLGRQVHRGREQRHGDPLELALGVHLHDGGGEHDQVGALRGVAIQ